MRKLALAILGVLMVCSAPAAVAADDALLLGWVDGTLERLKSTLAPDARQAIFEIKAQPAGQGRVKIKGVTSEQSARDAVVRELAENGIDFIDSIAVYPSDWQALVRIPVATIRTAGKHSAEVATQAVMGTPLRLLARKGEWYRVQTPDGYIGYIPSSSVAEKDAAQMSAWRSSPRYVVTDPWQIRVFATADASGARDVVSDLVNGCIVEAYNDQAPGAGRNGRLHVRLPDGRAGYVDEASLTPIAVWAAQDFDAQKILDTAYSMEGSPYLWGGTSTKAPDCSGMVKVSYLSNGLILMRDASQQARTGTRIEADQWRSCQPGDLLFFGTPGGRVTHVAIYDHDGNYVHSSGRVKRNSIDPASDAYLSTPFLHAVRIHGNEGTPGITRARDHAWYFNL